MLKPWRSVPVKLAALSCLFVLFVIALMAQRLLQKTEEGLVAEMKVRAGFFARSAREAIFPKVDPLALHTEVQELLKEKGVTHAAVLDEGDRALSHSDPKLLGETLPAPTAYEIVAPITVGSKQLGSVRIGYSRSSIEEALRDQKEQILLIAAGSTTLAIVGTILIVGWIMRPLPILAAAARQIGKGNFSVQVDLRSQDEIGLLAKAFNEMAVANALLFKTITQEKEKLETIFHDTQEGMIWTNPKGRILLINPSARTLLGCHEQAVDTIGQVLSHFAIRPGLAEILAGRVRIMPIEFQRKEPKLLVLSGVCDRLGRPDDPSGFLFVFHDATLEKRGETLSRNFLSLVSHKLRTPLAVALGFVELVLGEPQGLSDFHKHALKKVRDEDEKLRSLVEKLITFSTVQSPENIVLERTETSIAEAVETALKALSSLIEDKKVSVSWDRAHFEKLPKINADPLLLKECFSNLVENAVKFNPADPKTVSLSVALDDSHVRLAVVDNGPGIPSEEHPKLFRRFYQIDEHFTGQIQGFGLGLAFVKNVVEAHGGKVGLKSEPGKGSEFYFLLPLKK
ncbi:MAG: HAMP domain-containing protein [Elusimicrobia bacterium]|nr:HAMP domain-containing protein [Elusimicrobiota bacterium]